MTFYDRFMVFPLLSAEMDSLMHNVRTLLLLSPSDALITHGLFTAVLNIVETSVNVRTTLLFPLYNVISLNYFP